jgi:ATP-binding cassette, subfamily F, member 3
MLSLTHLSIRRAGRLLIEDANLVVQPGERCGLVGANGCGKSSLFALIRGELDADSGDCRLAGKPVIAHVAQETRADGRAALEHVLDGDAELRAIERDLQAAELHDDGTAIAHCHERLLSIDGYAAVARATMLMHGLGFQAGGEHAPIDSLSGGWRMRVSLASALMCRSDLLLLDEPTNHLDLDAVLWLQGWLARYPGTLLLISHDRDVLDRVCNRIIHIESGRLTAYSGNYADFERQRAVQLEQRQQAHARQQLEVARIRGFIERFRAKATKARQAQSRIKTLERMELITPLDPERSLRFTFPTPRRLPNPLISLDAVDCGYPGSRVLRGVSLTIAPGDRIGLIGRNGAGKSTLIQTIAGALPVLSGQRVAAQELSVGYFAQHQVEQLDDQATPLLHLERIDPLASVQTLRDFLGRFGFPGDSALSPVAPFSGGERARLALALIAYRKPNLLLLDEPTNHLDLDMRDALALALQAYEGAMVLIAHDRRLLDSSSDRLLLVHDGRVQGFDDDLDGYARWLSGAGSGANRAKPVSEHDRRGARRESARRQQQLKPLRSAVADLERALAAAQAAQTELDIELADPALYQAACATRLNDCLARRAELARELTRLEEHWIDAVDTLEQAESDESQCC